MFGGTNVVSEWIPVSDGRVNGVWETFYSDGNPKTRVGFLNGVLHGIDEEFTEDTQPLRHSINEHGQRSGLSTHWEYWENGQVKKKYSKLDGVLHGFLHEYFTNGSLRKKCSILNGVLHGEYEEYDERGRKTGCYEQGQKRGHWIYYFPDGTVKESGTWDEDGGWTRNSNG